MHSVPNTCPSVTGKKKKNNWRRLRVERKGKRVGTASSSMRDEALYRPLPSVGQFMNLPTSTLLFLFIPYSVRDVALFFSLSSQPEQMACTTNFREYVQVYIYIHVITTGPLLHSQWTRKFDPRFLFKRERQREHVIYTSLTVYMCVCTHTQRATSLLVETFNDATPLPPI